MPLRKPSEFFNENKPKSPLDVAKEELNSAAPEKIEKISEAFDSFKTNVGHLQKLSDFTNSFDTFTENIEKISALSEGIEQLQSEIQNFIKKEDLDDVMIAQLFFVEKSIRDVQEKVKTINSNTLSDIQKQIFDISNKVNNFVEIESVAYKKSIIDSETRIDNRFTNHKELVETKIEKIDEDILNKFLLIKEDLHDVNEKDIQEIKKDVKQIDKKVNFFIEEEIPNYKKSLVESELKVEKKLLDSEKFIQDKIDEIEKTYQSDFSSIEERIVNFVENEIPKFKSVLTETKFKSEEELKLISEEITQKVDKVHQDIHSLQKLVNTKNEEVENSLSEKILEIQKFIQESKTEIESTSKLHKNLYEDFKRREIHENKKLEDYSQTLEIFSDKLQNLEESLTEEVCELQGNLDISTSKYYDVLKKEVGFFEQNISNKLKDLEIDIVRNETHIQDARKNLEEAISKLNITNIEKKNKELYEKINQLESILEKFDEKKLLSEDASLTLAEPPNVKNSDPLTPLDQNYVTLKDLQDHYRIFINRVQQQLATIGGGGAGFMKDLADVSFDESTGTNKLLIYNGTNWVGIASTSLSGTTSLVNLTDVDTSNLGDGRFLRYDASTSEFTFAPVSASNLELIAGDIQSGILTTSSTNTAVVMSISASTYRSANYQVQVTEGTNYNMTTINVIHDGTNTYMTEYGTINQPIGVATFSTDISGGSLRLLGHPAFASSTTFKVVFTAIEV